MWRTTRPLDLPYGEEPLAVRWHKRQYRCLGQTFPITMHGRYARRMKFQEIAARMNGLSTPIGGVSWQPPVPDVTKARQIIAFLEDRRVLYNPYEFEFEDRCIESVIRIRSFLTDQLIDGPPGAELAAIVRAMRAACRKFLEPLEGRPREFGYSPPMDYRFNQALGELRASFGYLLGALAAKYGLDVEDELASILPVEE